MTKLRKGPLVAAGMTLGVGLGGFLDGILFHQIFQLHNMLSGYLPVTDLVSAKTNMLWDGFFHAGVWLVTFIGVLMLFNVAKRQDVIWSKHVLIGAMLAGWGLFNVVEGTIDHLILGIHHVVEYTYDKMPYDLAFLASGIILLLLGWMLIRKADH
jgi:uncharacterized membrane protein